jgi:hypothetical protein
MKQITYNNQLTKYTINEQGIVFGLRGQPLTQHSINGYKAVSLYINGVARNIAVHRLLALHFLPNANPDLHVNHKNQNRLDNRLSNLEMITHSANASLPKRITGKGIYEWKGKKNKFRVVMKQPNGKVNTIAYTVTYEEAEAIYEEAHLARYGVSSTDTEYSSENVVHKQYSRNDILGKAQASLSKKVA